MSLSAANRLRSTDLAFAAPEAHHESCATTPPKCDKERNKEKETNDDESRKPKDRHTPIPVDRGLVGVGWDRIAALHSIFDATCKPCILAKLHWRLRDIVRKTCI